MCGEAVLCPEWMKRGRAGVDGRARLAARAPPARGKAEITARIVDVEFLKEI